MITGINESKTLKKDTSCKRKYRFDGRKCNSDQRWNNDKCSCECEKHHVCEKDDCRTVSRPDSSPTDTSRRRNPRLTLPRRTLPRRTFPRTDNSPTGHFPEGHFPDWTFPH